jgi:hypothetical protein
VGSVASLGEDLDIAAGTNRCNCSICSKARAWFAFAKGVDALRVTDGEASLTEYRWTPSTGPHLVYRFCKVCGVRAYATGELEALGGRFYAVHVPILDDVDPEELAAAPIHYIDGKNGRFESAPEDTRTM